MKSTPQLIQEIRADLRCVTVAEALIEIASNRGVIIDVREPSECAEKSVPISTNIPRGILEMKITELCPLATNDIYVHCATGGRATFAAEQLQRLGYENVSVITSDIDTIINSLE